MYHKPGDWIPLRFIAQEIEVEFDTPSVLAKKPNPPSSFSWQGAHFKVANVLSRWFNHERKGRMARNMKPAHLRVASRRGSWGVGRYYFRVETEGGQIFDLYYDRAPEDAGDRKGHWYLWREMKEA